MTRIEEIAVSAPVLREVPIVLCSADVHQLRQRQEEMTALADIHVLEKPFALADAEDLVGRLLART